MRVFIKEAVPLFSYKSLNRRESVFGLDCVIYMHFFRIGLSKQEIRQNELAQSLTYRRKMNVNMSVFRESFNN